MFTFPIWIEGSATNGEGRVAARYEGEWPGETFAEACAAWAKQKDAGPAYRGMDLFDPQRLTWWGCRLFDNEAAARKVFG